MRIDAHHHLWQVDRGDYTWLRAAEHSSINRDFLADAIRPLLQAAKVDRTILVQAAESIGETEYLLAIAAREDFVGGVVGWIDFEHSDAIEQLVRLARHPKLVGLRPMLQDMRDAQWILRPQFAPIFRQMRQQGLRFDALIKPRHLPVFVEFARCYPWLPLVIDHAAKPNIADDGFAQWAAGIKAFTDVPHVHCKLSGLATEAGPAWNADKLRAYVDVLLDTFGPKRLMWGSDWPVLLLAGDYLQWLRVAEELTGGLCDQDRARVFGITAAQFYGINHD